MSVAVAGEPPRQANRLRAVATVTPFIAWPLYCLARGEWNRWELVVLLIVAVTLAIASDASRRLLTGLYPLGLVALFYDAMRFVKHVGISSGRVHDCDLRTLETRFFGWHTANGGAVTVHDWFRDHHALALDLLGAIPYGTFIWVAVAFAYFLYTRDAVALRLFGWSFLLLNVAAFATHHLYPAAPPWYYHAHGCVIDARAAASEGPALARVDQWLGVGYFRGFYARSQDVFGAVPSLHVGYPLLCARFGWTHFNAAWKSTSLVFLALMCFAAVYLDHHWIIDVVLGLAYGLAAEFVVRKTVASIPRATPAPV